MKKLPYLLTAPHRSSQQHTALSTPTHNTITEKKVKIKIKYKKKVIIKTHLFFYSIFVKLIGFLNALSRCTNFSRENKSHYL